MKAWLYILTTGLIFGVGGPVTKYLIEQGLDPVFLTGALFVLAALTALPIHRWAGGAPRRAWGWALALGALNGSAPALLFNLGFQRLPVSINTVLISLGPVFTAVGAHFLVAGDRFNGRKALGLVLCLGGVTVLTGFSPGGSIASTGIALTVAGAALQGLTLLGVKRLASLYPPANTLAPMMAGAALLAVVTAIWASPASAPTFAQWLLIAALGVSFPLAYGAILLANQIAPASQVALSAYLIPLLGVLIGVLIFREKFGLSLVLGAILVISGVMIVGSQNREREKIVAGTLPGP